LVDISQSNVIRSWNKVVAVVDVVVVVDIVVLHLMVVANHSCELILYALILFLKLICEKITQNIIFYLLCLLTQSHLRPQKRGRY